MLEYPEALTVARQIKDEVVGKKIRHVYPPVKEHKFCWFSGSPKDYDAKMSGAIITYAESFGMYVEMTLDNGVRLCFHDGVNARLGKLADTPKNYQLLIEFTDETALVFTVTMYGGILLHDGDCDNPYYLKSRAAISPFSDAFAPYYNQILAESKPSLSAKAFVATEQRFPGIGNGVLQDILLAAGIHPKRKLGTLNAAEQERLRNSIKAVLKEMVAKGGRDTEKDLYGQQGGYQTRLSKNTLDKGCPHCKARIIKEAYLGGAVYFCPVCQPLDQ